MVTDSSVVVASLKCARGFANDNQPQSQLDSQLRMQSRSILNTLISNKNYSPDGFAHLVSVLG